MARFSAVPPCARLSRPRSSGCARCQRHPLLPVLGLVLLLGCRPKEQARTSPEKNAAETSPAASAGPTPGNAPANPGSADLQKQLASVDNSLKKGSYDEAAANLLKLQMNGAQFSQQEAAAYRNALSDAYTKALEAANQGDPKAKAALQMIRASRSR